MIEERISCDDVDFNECPSLIYYHPLNGKLLAINLLSFAKDIFNDAERIKYFPKYKLLLDKKKNDIDAASPFIMQNLIDVIKICICFENYMKAILLVNGYIIHKLNSNNLYKQLRKEQKERPIQLLEVQAIEDFTLLHPTIKQKLPGIVKETIGFNTMLSPKYQEIIKINRLVFPALKQYNDYRNNLHLFSIDTFTINVRAINSVMSMMSFVNTDMNNLYYDLMQDLTPDKDYVPNAPKISLTLTKDRGKHL